MQKHKCKRLLSLLLTAAMLLSLLSVTAFAEASDFAGGTGTAEDPYLIATTEQLAKATETGKYYLLTNDLTVGWSVPCRTFSGTFDGGGHTISGLKTSLFEKIGAGGNVEIKNLNLVGYNSTSQRGMVFGSGNTSSSTITLSNIHVTITGGNATASGLAGEQGNSPLTIENCSVVVKSGSKISTGDQAGGLVRHLRGKVNLKDSFVYIEEGASIISTGNTYGGAGGLAGVLSHAVGGSPSITNCYVINKGTISNNQSTETNAAGVGALIGTNWSQNVDLTVKNTYVYNSGTISSGVEGCAGILVGHMKLYNANTTVKTITMDNLVAYTNGVPMVGKVEAGTQGTEGSTVVDSASEIAGKIPFEDTSWLQNASISPAYNSISGLAGVPYLKMEETAELATKFTEVNKNGDDDVTTALESAYSGYTLTGVTNGGTSLLNGTDYTFANGTLTVNNSYIKTLSKGTTTLTLTFDKGLSVNFYIHVVEKPVVRLGTAANGSAVFADGTTKARDAVADSTVTVIAKPDTGYILKGWKVGDVEQLDSAKEEWTYTLPGTIEGDIIITPVFELNNNYVAFTLKDELNASADMSGAVVTITKDSTPVATWTWNSAATYHKALDAGTYQYKVEKAGYITKNGSFDVAYSGTPVAVELTIGKYYVGPYATEQKLTASGSGNGIYTVSYTLEKIRAVSGQLTVTLPTGVTLMSGAAEATDGDVTAAVSAETGITVGSAALNGNTLTITWGASEGVTPRCVDALNAPKTILSFNVKPTYGSAATVTASGSVADNRMEGGPQTYTDSTLSASVGVDMSKESTPSATFTATGPDTGKLSGVSDGMKYQVGSGDWTDISSSDDINLTELSACTISVVKKGNGSTTTDSDAQSITVTKADAPNLTATQPSTIGGKGSVPTTEAHEFSSDNSTWSACTGTTENLEPGTYYVRVKASGTALASAAQTIVINAYSANKETIPSATFTATGPDTGKLSGVSDGMKYQVGSGDWTDISSSDDINLTDLSACTISVVKKGNGTTTTDSDAQSITVAKAVTPISIGNTDCTTSANNDGTLTNVDTTMEYQKSGDSDWTVIVGTTVTGLTDGTYYVRVKASGNTLASDNQTVTITAYTAITVTSIEVNSIGHKTTYTVGETLDVTGLKILVTKSDSSTETVDVTPGMVTGFDSSAAAASQTLTITYEGKTTTYNISITAPSVYSITPDTTGTYLFTAATVGYEAQAAKTVTVNNNGTAATGTLSVALSGANADNFTLSRDSLDSIAVGESDSFTVVPNVGLSAGTYTAIVTISGDHDIAASFNVSFTVNAAPVVYTITFDPNGGAVTPTNGVTGADGKLSSLPTPARSDSYSFNGWYTAASGGTQVTTSTVFDANVTIYAQWTYTGGSGSSGGSGSTTNTVSAPTNVNNGTVSVSPKSASKGTTVTITVNPDEGYKLDSLTVTDKNGNEIKLTDKGNGKYTFTMPASKVTIESTFVEIEQPVDNPFVDVKEDAYYFDAALWAAEKGITTGTSADTFSPNADCTRAQIVTFLWRAAGSPAPKSEINPFADLSTDAYYYSAVLWAVEQGITNGTSADAFSPDAVCTRAQTVTFLYRAAGSPEAGAANSFTDVNHDSYYTSAVDWAVDEGVTAGTSNSTFSPNADCTRGQIVTFLYRWMFK